MLAYIIHRLLLLPLVIVGVILLVFTMMQFLGPYQRLSTYIQNPQELKQLQTVPVEVMIEKYNLDDPPWMQFWRWVKKLARGNLGWSEAAKRPVFDAFMRYFPATMELALWAMVPVIFIGIWLGTLAAVNHNNLIDHAARVFAIFGWSLPTFVAGLVLLMFFYGFLGWFPPGRLSVNVADIVHSEDFVRYTTMNTVDAVLNWNWAVFWDALKHLILPIITLAYIQWAMLLRIMRSSMLETLRKDYIQTARAKGLKENVVIKKHARRNALIPAVTVAGLIVAFLMNGVVITETVFNYQGLGRWAVMAAQQFDVPALLGFILFNGLLIVMANLVVDVLYAYIDPRVRLE